MEDSSSNQQKQQESAVESLSWTVMLGIMLLMIGCTVDNLGITLQKMAHRRQSADLSSPPKKCYCSDWRWTSGLLLYLFGNILNAIALPFTPQSLYAALGSISLVINVLTSRLILKESLNKLIVIGTCVIISGSIAAVVFGDHVSPSYDLEYFEVHAGKPFFVTYFVLLIISIALLVFCIHTMENLENDHTLIVSQDLSNVRSINSDVSEGAEPGVRTDLTCAALLQSKGIYFTIRWLFRCGMMQNNPVWRKRMLSVMYPLLAGMIGSITLLSAKAAAEMVSAASSGRSEFGKGTSYLFFIVVSVLGCTQIHVLNLGLKKFDQIIVIPVFTVALESFSVVISVIFFEEYLLFNVYQSIFFPVAILVTYAGVYVTAVGQKSRISVEVKLEGIEQPSEYTSERAYKRVKSEGEDVDADQPISTA